MEIQNLIASLPTSAQGSVANSMTTRPFPRDRELHPKTVEFTEAGGWEWVVTPVDRRAEPGSVTESEGVYIKNGSALQMFEEVLRFASDASYDYEEQCAAYKRRIDAHQRNEPVKGSLKVGCKGRWLTLLGRSGNGKTHLSRKLGVYRREKLKMFNSAVRQWPTLENGIKNGKWNILADFYSPQVRGHRRYPALIREGCSRRHVEVVRAA